MDEAAHPAQQEVHGQVGRAAQLEVHTPEVGRAAQLEVHTQEADRAAQLEVPNQEVGRAAQLEVHIRLGQAPQ